MVDSAATIMRSQNEITSTQRRFVKRWNSRARRNGESWRTFAPCPSRSWCNSPPSKWVENGSQWILNNERESLGDSESPVIDQRKRLARHNIAQRDLRSTCGVVHLSSDFDHPKAYGQMGFVLQHDVLCAIHWSSVLSEVLHAYSGGFDLWKVKIV